MNILISGGCKNGKSFFAQRLAKDMAQGGPLYYVATMRPVDDEDKQRIQRHICERDGWGFTTIEQNEHICSCLDRPDVEHTGIFLLDSVTALLSNEMFAADGTFDLGAPERVADELIEFAKLTGNTIFVSDYIYSDAIQYETLTETYKKGLAHIDKTLAAVCGRVAEVAYGNLNWFK